MSRLDPDDDYQYDRTNPPASRETVQWRNERIAKAQKCLSFQPQEHLRETCLVCGGPKFAHAVHARRSA